MVKRMNLPGNEMVKNMINSKLERSGSMKGKYLFTALVLLVLCGLMGLTPAYGHVFVQCPADTDGVDTDGDGVVDNDVVCIQLTAGDGYQMMADGNEIYSFGFHDVTGVPEADIEANGLLSAEFAAPTMAVREGQRLYLTLTTVPMAIRPDLFDPHTVHFHGFPNASTVFDGEPMASLAINAGASLTYFYNLVEPGTFMYHCHVEATEHMQMGMLGNLYVKPIQDFNAGLLALGSPSPYIGFAYNDGDGSTGYHVEQPIQVLSFDPLFHAANENVQPLPFAAMHDTYPLFNGRGYPDTIDLNPLAAAPSKVAYKTAQGLTVESSQNVSSLITANSGEKILIRLSSLSTVDFYTVSVLGIPMKVIGKGARILRSGGVPGGTDLYYETSSVTLGGGEAVDIVLDTTGIPTGTYFMYSTNLNELSNDAQEFGGMMTEIVIN